MIVVKFHIIDELIVVSIWSQNISVIATCIIFDAVIVVVDIIMIYKSVHLVWTIDIQGNRQKEWWKNNNLQDV